MFGVRQVSQHVELGGDELKVIGLSYDTPLPDGVTIVSAFASINSSHIQATIRNVAGTAANITLKNQRPTAADGTAYLVVFYMPAVYLK